MIELKRDSLVVSFPEVHPSATLKINFQRTLRIPDDGANYPLPPGLAKFPLRHVDDFEGRVPKPWIEHGGVAFPMYQSEAMWIRFDGTYDGDRCVTYPFAVKIATGKVSAISGEGWLPGLNRAPQDYVIVPDQPWLDGYCVEKGVIRQFVAMPLGSGYSAEEQITGNAEYGGLQILAYPMKREAFEKRFPKRERVDDGIRFMLSDSCVCESAAPDMSLAPGGRMRQEIYEDPYTMDDWDLNQSSRCFVHISNSLVWQSITTEAPPAPPPTAAEYERAGLPWFDWYDDSHQALNGRDKLAGLKSVVQLGKEKGDVPLPENASVNPTHVVALKQNPDQVREWKALDPPCSR
jgi:hypothetical protein